jgi:hypothetical protein
VFTLPPILIRSTAVKQKLCLEGERRFAKMARTTFRTLKRARQRGLIEPDGFFGEHPAYFATAERIQEVEHVISSQLRNPKK